MADVPPGFVPKAQDVPPGFVPNKPVKQEKPQGMRATTRYRQPEPVPGSSPEHPLQEQGVSFDERMALKVFGPNEGERAAEWLRRTPGEGGKPVRFSVLPFGETLSKFTQTSATRQYDAVRNARGQIAVRPKGSNEQWRLIDPEGFDWQDITDLGGEAAMALTPARTAKAVAGVAGVGEATRRGLGQLYGFQDSPMDVATDVALNAATAGTAAKIIPNIPKLLQAPRKLEKWMTMQGPRGKLATAEAKAAAEVAERAKNLPKELAAGQKIAEETLKAAPAPQVTPEPSLSPEAASYKKFLEGAMGKPPGGGFDILPGVLHPTKGVTAANVTMLPEFAEIGRKWFGEQFLPRLGSQAMKSREQAMSTLSKTLKPAERTAAVDGYTKDIGLWMLGSDRFKAMTASAKEAAARVAKGKGSAEDLKLMETLVRQATKDAATPPYILAAKAELAAAKANPTRRKLEELYRLRRSGIMGWGAINSAVLGAHAAEALGLGLEKGGKLADKYTAGAAQRALRALPYLAPSLIQE